MKAAQAKIKMSKADSAILDALPEPYRAALLYLHTAGAEDSIAHGHPPMTVVQLMQQIIYSHLAQSQQYGANARTAFEILIAPDFIKSLKAWYETPEKDCTDAR
jgi:hypothetical protein